MPLPIQERKIPSELAKSPLINSTVEIRFEPIVPHGAVFGILLSLFRDEYPNVEALPISQLPEIVREQDENLMYSPLYKLFNDKFIIQIGPRSLSIGCINGYKGWGEFLGMIDSTFNRIHQAGIATEILRVGLRYVNFFPGNLDIFEKVNDEISSEGSILRGNRSLIKTEIEEDGLVHILQISNSASANQGGVETNGSLIDLDVFKDSGLENFFSEIGEQATELHDVIKRIFFGLLKEEFINTMDPTYES